MQILGIEQKDSGNGIMHSLRLGQFYQKKTQKNCKCCFFRGLHKLKNNRLCDVRNDKYTNLAINSLEYFCL